MRICMVSPHLPPERGPSASLPAMLGSELRGSDVESDYLTYLPDTPFGPAPVPGTRRVPHQGRSSFAPSRTGAGIAALRIARVARHCQASQPSSSGAIHVAGWVSLLTLHVIWPFLWIWATLYREDRGWGFQTPNPSTAEALAELKADLAAVNGRLQALEQAGMQ